MITKCSAVFYASPSITHHSYTSIIALFFKSSLPLFFLSNLSNVALRLRHLVNLEWCLAGHHACILLYWIYTVLRSMALMGLNPIAFYLSSENHLISDRLQVIWSSHNYRVIKTCKVLSKLFHCPCEKAAFDPLFKHVYFTLDIHLKYRLLIWSITTSSNRNPSTLRKH